MIGARIGHNSTDIAESRTPGNLQHETTTRDGDNLTDSKDNFTDSKATTLQERNLGDKIISALESSQSTSGDRKKFLPSDQIDAIFTLEAVQEELQRHFKDSERSSDDLRSLAHRICDPAEVSTGCESTRKIIFATLVRIEEAPRIVQFIAEGLYDCHLPFRFPSVQSEDGLAYRQAGPDEGQVPIQLFSQWGPFDRESFEQYQWEFQAPFFKLDSDEQHRRPLHYEFPENAILPFMEDHEGEGLDLMQISGGFSDVWRIKIHQAHHNYPSDNNPYLAVKRLKPNMGRDKEIFQREVSTLKRLSGRHPHLMSLLLTYEYRGRFHLLFLWSDGNLRDYWERHPSPATMPRTQEFASWLSKQWLGLTEALLSIHMCAPDQDVPVGERKAHDEQRTNGRHGDIKPENILRFKSRSNRHEQHLPGTLVVADFGVTQFHRDETGEVSPKDLARSPTYRAPEYDVRETLSQSYDIWSLGCVLLEFITWYLKGYDAFDQFSRNRARDDNSPGNSIRQDVYFNVFDSPAKNGRSVKAAQIKRSVAKQFEELREDVNATEFLLDALDFIEDQMLRMGPEKRATCADVVERFRRIHNNCVGDEAYCVGPAYGRPKRAATDLSTLYPRHISDPMDEAGVPKHPRTRGQIDHHITYIDFQQRGDSSQPSSGSQPAGAPGPAAAGSSPLQPLHESHTTPPATSHGHEPVRRVAEDGAEEPVMARFTWKWVRHKLRGISCFQI